jgi:hypothetical protein
MLINKRPQPSVGADLPRPSPIMAKNTMHRTAVGADLSCASPIYRPSEPFTISLLKSEFPLSALHGYHDMPLFFKVHFRL